MRQLVPIAALLVAAALVWILFLRNAGTPDPGPEEPVAAETLAPVTTDLRAAPERDRAEPAEASFTNRMVKTGSGRFGLHGVVVDENEQPVPNAWVAAYSSPFPLLDFEFEISEIFQKPLDFSLEPLASEFADEEGRFALAGVPGRTIYLVGRTRARLTPRRQRVLPTELDGEQGVVLRTVPGAELEGRVVNAEGAPVAGAEVLVGPGIKYLIASFRNRRFFVERAMTDADGRFRVEAVPAGMRLTVNAFDGAVRSGMGEFGPLMPNTTGQSAVRMDPLGGLSGRVVDQEGAGVRGVMVVAVPLDLRRVLPFVRDIPGWTTTSGSNGRYRFPELPKGNTLLLAQGREGRAAPVSAPVTGDKSLSPDITLDTKTRLDGRVVDGTGKPVAGALVKLQSIPSGADDRTPRQRARQMAQGGFILEAAQEILPEILPQATFARTDDKGRFSLGAWRKARLRVSAVGFPDADFDLDRADEKDGEPVLVVLAPGSVEGLVIDGAAGKPVQFYLARAELDSVPADEIRAAVGPLLEEDEWLVVPRRSWRSQVAATHLCDSPDGRFKITDMPPGKWFFTVQAEGFSAESETDFEVRSEETTRGVVVSLGRGALVLGKVIDAASREPLAGAVVTVGRGEESGFVAMFQGLDKSTAMAETAEDGTFEVSGVREGSDHVNVLAEGHAAASEEISPIQAEEVREDVLVMVKLGGTVTGVVTDRHGNRLPGRMVGALSIQARDFQQTATDGEGYYKMEHMKQGAYFMVTAALDDDSLFQGDIASVLTSSRILTAYVSEGEVTTVDIVDQSAGGCALSGRILRSGVALPGANIMAFAGERSGLLDFRMASARSDELGEFRFKNLAPGSYVLNVEAEEWDGQFEIEVEEVPEDFILLEVPRTVVRGRVVAEQTGAPIEDANVQLIREDGLATQVGMMFGGGGSRDWETTDEEGKFSFSGVIPGQYRLEVSSSSRWRRRSEEDANKGPSLGSVTLESFQLGVDEVKDFDLVRLPLAGDLKVLAVDSSGQAFQRGFSVRVAPSGENLEADGDFDFSNRGWGNGGEAVVSGLKPGFYQVIVEADGYAATEVDGVEVRMGETVEQQVVLARGSTLKVRLLDPQNRPVAGARIELYNGNGKRMNPDGGIGAAFRGLFGGDGDGAQEVGTYAPGSYRLKVTWEERTQERDVLLVEGQEEVVEIRF